MSDTRTRLDAALADRYRLERELGEGGMATVYLAEDLKHDRRVAVKVLRPELAAVIGAERFLQEIKLTANLQHPHILPLHDSGEADSFLYYVMPYVEGESLRDKLNREKQFGVDEAIRLATQVAAALDYAHRQGVVHRDIKPENVLLHDGNAQVADFGIALAVSAAGSSRMTETGMSIGTPQYMSPEQAMGDRELDARSDIYSLAAMLYEMLTGDPPYTGSTAQAIVAKVITEKAPPVSLHRDTVPPHVSAAIAHALNKLPADRFASAAAFADALVRPGALAHLTQPSAETAGGAPVAPRPWWHLAGAVLVGVVVTAAAMWTMLGEVEAPGPVTRFEVTTGDVTLRGSLSPALAFSPDGSKLVFPGTGGLFLRDMDQLEVRLIPGTEGAVNVAFSPDGDWIIYDSSNELKKVRLAGGGAITVARDIRRGATWGPDGTIVYANGDQALVRMTDAGADARVIVRPDTSKGETGLRYPDILPDGVGVLFTIWSTGAEGAHIAVWERKSGAVRDLGPGMSAKYVDPGFVMFADPVGGSLLAAPFDLGRLEMGDPVPVLEGVGMTPAGGLHAVVSRSGSLAYLTGAQGGSSLLQVDRRGAEVPLSRELRGFWEPRYSPDGRRIAVRVSDENSDIWIYDIVGNTQTRLTVEGNNFDPAWRPDGSAVTFSSFRQGRWGIFTRPWDGSAPADSLVTAENPHVAGWSPDGMLLVFRGGELGNNRDILIASASGEPRAYLESPFNETAPQISPNGKWLAYQSDESGPFEIYVRPFPDGGGRIPISTSGGIEPVWGPDGKELFYISADDQMLVAVEVETEGTFRVGARTPLFNVSDFNRRVVDVNYDIHPDGQSFVMLKPQGTARGLIVIQNWIEEVREAVGGSRRP